jgi:hypothetical protein
VDFEDAMDDGYIPPVQLEDDYITHRNGGVGHIEEQEVPPVERWLHAPAGL